MVPFFLDQCSLSHRIDTLVSRREIEEVNAANSTRMKNAAPIKPPKAVKATVTL